MEPIRVAFILSVCFHLFVLEVSSFFIPKAKIYSTPYIVTLIHEEIREEPIKGQKPRLERPKVPKKGSLVKNKSQEKKKSKKKAPGVNKKAILPKADKSKKKVKEEKKDPAIHKSYKEVQKAVAQIQQKEKQKSLESIRQSVENIQQKLLEQKMAAVQETQILAQEQTNFFMKAYHNQVWNLIKSHWLIPDSGYDKGKELLTVISIRVGNDGSIQDIKFESESGEPVFDRSTLMAIKRVGSFPPFPPEMPMDSIEIGVRFFPTEE